MPIGICRAEPTVEETAMRMQDDDEIPGVC